MGGFRATCLTRGCGGVDWGCSEVLVDWVFKGGELGGEGCWEFFQTRGSRGESDSSPEEGEEEMIGGMVEDWGWDWTWEEVPP